MSDFEILVGQLMEEQQVIKDTLATGKVDGIAEYKRICGKFEGLGLAIRMINEFRDRIDEEFDDE